MTGRWVSVVTIALVVSSGVAVPRVGSSQPSPSARRYTLHALGRCLDVAGGVSANGRGVQLYECNGTPAQEWTFSGETISALGRCLDVEGAVGRDGQRVQLYECNRTIAQRWTTTGGTIRSVLGRCLDVAGGVSANGQGVQPYQCNGTPAQTWTLEPVPGP